MTSIRTQVIATLALLALLLGASSTLAQPAIFQNLGVKEAIERTSSNDRILVVKATAVWCGPCKRMDATTWVDDSVVAWINEHGLATQFDVDEQPKLARELRVQAMPTMIAFRNGEEFDRIVGYRDADGLLAWMNDVKAGKTSLDRVREAAGDRAGEDGRVDIQARLSLARELSLSGRFQEATDEFVWLWDNMLDHQPSMYGVRLSFMVGDMQGLAAQSVEARERFAGKRDELGKALRTERGRTWDNLRDWVALNDVIQDDAAVLAWIDRVKDRDNGPATLRRMDFVIENVLMRNERYEDLTLIGWDPVAEMRQSLAFAPAAGGMVGDMDERQREQMLTSMERFQASSAGEALYASIRGGHLQHVEPLLELCDKEFERVDGLSIAVNHVLSQGEAHRSLLAPLDKAIEAESDPTRKRSLRALRGRVLSSLEN
jgi:thioredoxin 1